MKYIQVLAEGITEETFIGEILNPYFENHNLFLQPTVIQTSRGYRGGGVSYDRVKLNLKQLLKRTYSPLVTTMIDFYGLANQGFPGWDTMTGNCYEKAAHVEAAIADDIDSIRFKPYLALHEFEALLFTKPEIIASELSITDQRSVELLNGVMKKYDSPEEINLDTPPSKRIESVSKRYRKVGSGIPIAAKIGLNAMREQCPHFDQWMKMLEALA